MKPQHLEVAGLREDGKQAIKSKTGKNRKLLFLTLSYGRFQQVMQQHYPASCG